MVPPPVSLTAWPGAWVKCGQGDFEEVSVAMLARRSMWQDLFDMEREANDLFRRLFGTGWVPSAALVQDGSGRSMWAPKVDVFFRDGSLVVRAELPRVDPDKDVDISVEDGVLAIKGERRN